MSSYAYQPHSLKMELRQLPSGKWSWRVMDFFGEQLAASDKHGCVSRQLAASEATAAKDEYIAGLLKAVAELENKK